MKSSFSLSKSNQLLQSTKIQEEKQDEQKPIKVEFFYGLIIGEKQFNLDKIKQKKDELLQCIQKSLPQIEQIYNTKPNFKVCQMTKTKTITGLDYILENLKDEDCPICISPWFDTTQPYEALFSEKVIGLDCDHYYHGKCLDNWIKETHLQCPICNRIYGIKTGDQPDGYMNCYVDNSLKCQGYEQYDTIVIHYKMSSGIINGVKFHGTQRVAYLPNCPEGQQILHLLKIAFDRKLIFTVGRSVTTGKDNQTVWAGIHHKTSLSGGSSKFGYPDPTYFQRVREELASRGVI